MVESNIPGVRGGGNGGGGGVDGGVDDVSATVVVVVQVLVVIMRGKLSVLHHHRTLRVHYQHGHALSCLGHLPNKRAVPHPNARSVALRP